MATVLVVDDEAQQRAQIGRELVQGRHQVDKVPGSNQGLLRLKERCYDLLITDLMMDEG